MEVYGLLCTTLGKTPAEVGRMRMPEVARLFEYWGRSPPVHLMVASYFGIDGKKKSEITDDGLIAMLGARQVPG